MIVRVLLAVAAVAAAVWVGTSLRAAQLNSQATDEVRTSIAGGPKSLTAAQRHRYRQRHSTAAADLFERARKWAPYQAPVITEAGLLATTGRQRRAVELLNDLVGREPDNPEAWARLAEVLGNSDPARARFARQRARELIPPVDGR